MAQSFSFLSLCFLRVKWIQPIMVIKFMYQIKFFTDLCFWKVTLSLEMKFTLENKLEGDHFTLYLLNVAHASLCVYSVLTSPALQTLSAVQPAMWQGLGCVVALQCTLSLLCASTPTPSPRLGSPAVFYLFLCLVSISCPPSSFSSCSYWMLSLPSYIASMPPS